MLKQRKKKMFLVFSRVIGLYRGLIWQASSSYEEQDILETIGPETAEQIIIAPDLPPMLAEDQLPSPESRRPSDSLRIVFLSRISPKKNVDYALETLRYVDVPIKFDIYGPIDDERYWERCQQLIKHMPANIEVNYSGSIEHEQVIKVLGSYDLFFLPTAGENYGHVILESMLAGTPVLISNTTPWRNLSAIGVGWDVPLTERNQFIGAIKEAAAMSIEELGIRRTKVRDYGLRSQFCPHVVEANQRLFLLAQS